ncbi:MAG: hypothetical protein ACR2HH_06885 [Chthoniobacterales bacterium]
MSDNQQPHPEKKVTAATTDAPQEEFISPENIPSKSETGGEPPRERTATTAPDRAAADRE